MAEVVFGALIDAGWPAQRAAEIGALMRYYITGSALGSLALGFPADLDLYDRYPHVSQAHLLNEHRWEVDEGAFELGLSALLEGLVREYDGTTRSSRSSPRSARP